MAIAASDQDLAIAMLKQSCFDCFNGDKILEASAEFSGAWALSLAQSQQACEKALKAWIYFKVGTREYSKPTHLVWGYDLQIESLYPANPGKKVWSEGTENSVRGLRQSFAQLLEPSDINALQEIENVAPFRCWDKPNTEYPWVDPNGVVHIPAEYFDEHVVLKMSRLAHRIVKVVACETGNPKFQNEFKKIKLSYSDR